MPQIRAEGFLEGERMRSLSAQAWCMWTFFYAASNGYGRFQLDYKLILATAFRHYPATPTEQEVFGWLREYKEKFLLFVYQAEDGTLWGAFDSQSGQRYFNAEDKRSPAPPEPAFAEWMKTYDSKKKSKTARKSSSFLDGLLDSTPKQHDLCFDVETTTNERRVSVEPPQHNTTSTHNTQHNFLNTTQENLDVEEIVLPEADVEEWAEAVYDRHPKQKFKAKVIETLVERFGLTPESRAIFERNHAAWCGCPDWVKHPEYVPLLVERDGGGWIADDTWKHPPIRAIPVRSVQQIDAPKLSLEERLEMQRATVARLRGAGLHANADREEVAIAELEKLINAARAS